MGTSDEPRLLPLFDGGPLARAERFLGIRKDDPRDGLRQWLAFLIVGWLPAQLIGLAWALHMNRWDHLLRLEIPVRAFVSVPLLYIGAAIVEQQINETLRGLVPNLFQPSQEGALRRAIAQTRRLAASNAMEVLLLVAAFATTVAALTRLRLPGPGVWWALGSEGLFRFLVYRWLWRWSMWCVLLVRLAAMRPRIITTHPDHAGGLAIFAHPSTAFGVAAMGMTAAVAATWGGALVRTYGSFKPYHASLIALVAIALLLAYFPLLAFASQLLRAKRHALHEYGAFAQRYTSLFQQKWIVRAEENQDPLGSSDIQSLADLANSFAIVKTMRGVPFARADLIAVAGAAVLPMLPLFLTEVPLGEIVTQVLKVFG
jgi:hypothetical protein